MRAGQRSARQAAANSVNAYAVTALSTRSRRISLRHRPRRSPTLLFIEDDSKTEVPHSSRSLQGALSQCSQ
jgi:hypothetical protein